ncbi:MAG: hypothetical protein J6T16_00975 [Opitutales bacterium]|nr:hypothetical protein [Opitutales bacterium]
MKIKYANFYICGAENPPSNFSLSIKKTLQTDKAIGFENAAVSDMGNCVCAVSFGVENSHKSPAAADEFCIEFLRDVAAASAEDLEIFFGEGESQKSFKIEGAALSKCRASVEGRSTRHLLEFEAAIAKE